MLALANFGWFCQFASIELFNASRWPFGTHPNNTERSVLVFFVFIVENESTIKTRVWTTSTSHGKSLNYFTLLLSVARSDIASQPRRDAKKFSRAMLPRSGKELVYGEGREPSRIKSSSITEKWRTSYVASVAALCLITGRTVCYKWKSFEIYTRCFTLQGRRTTFQHWKLKYFQSSSALKWSNFLHFQWHFSPFPALPWLHSTDPDDPQLFISLQSKCVKQRGKKS